MKRKVIMLAFLAGIILPVGEGWAKKVAVVLSKSTRPYQEALLGLQATDSFQLVEYNLQGSPAQGREIMHYLRSQNEVFNLVVVIGSGAVKAAQIHSPGIPLLFTMVLKQPTFSGKVSGVIMQVKPDDQFLRIKKMLPSAVKIGVIYNPAHTKKIVKQAGRSAKKNGLTLVPVIVEKPEEVSAALKELSRKKIDVLWSVLDRTVIHPVVIKKIIKYTLEEKMPYIALTEYQVKAGALAAFSVDCRDIGLQTAKIAEKMLVSSDKPAGRVESPRKIITYINPATRKHLGIKGLSRIDNIRFQE